MKARKSKKEQRGQKNNQIAVILAILKIIGNLKIDLSDIKSVIDFINAIFST